MDAQATAVMDMTPGRRRLQQVGTALGILLLGAAVWVALRDLDLSQVPPDQAWRLAPLAAAVAANLLLTGALFWAVTLSFDAMPRVGLVRMTGLIAVTTLLNYLPLRPGLLGRAAYLKAKHQLPLRQSVVIMLVVTAIGAVVLGGAATIGLLYPPSLLPWATTASGFALLLASAATPPLARRMLRRPVIEAWSWPLLRAADLLAGAARLWLAFAIVGQPLPFAHALTICAAGMFVSLLPIVPNGLGLREWVVAALAPTATAAGLAAAVIDRAVEIGINVPAGLAALPLLKGSGMSDET